MKNTFRGTFSQHSDLEDIGDIEKGDRARMTQNIKPDNYLQAYQKVQKPALLNLKKLLKKPPVMQMNPLNMA